MNTENKLPEDFKQRWVAALRSGEYKQGRETLHNAMDNTYCCLGVACRITQNNVPSGAFIPNDPEQDFNPELVPKIIRSSYGFAGKLAAMNDGAGEYHENPKSFSEIADWIEQNL